MGPRRNWLIQEFLSLKITLQNFSLTNTKILWGFESSLFKVTAGPCLFCLVAHILLHFVFCLSVFILIF